MQRTLRRLLLFAIDAACTVLTLMTGFQENPILVALTGRYQLIRSRFKQGNVNYNIIRDDHFDPLMLVDLPKLTAFEALEIEPYKDEFGDELLAYGSPRHSLLSGDGGSGDPQALLAFYRQRCEQFQQERQETLDRLAHVEVSKEELHRLKWELRTAHEEVSELEAALKQANAALFGAKSDLVDVHAEADKLRAQALRDRQKIQQLLALTQPITEEVAFFRDCRPGASASFPVARQTFEYASTMHIASEMGTQPRRSSAGQPARRSAGGRRERPAVRAPPPPANPLLRTVYLPNEQAAALATTAESLQQQLAAHRQLADERSQALLDEFAAEKAKLLQRASHADAKAQAAEQQLARTQRLLHETTKDYLVLRHRSQEAERLAREELSALQERCATLATERSHAAQQAAAETLALQRSAQEEGSVCAEQLRSQALSRERDLRILKEQYAAVQDACTRRIQDLQARLATLRGRYRSLERRRAMEMEGFTRDVVALKRHLQKLEVVHYGRRLSAQERRLDEHVTLDANELSEEVAALQLRARELALALDDASCE